ncbi:protein kinase domain-containing protein [Streptomyces hoynatensis]|uniref:Serine/threonine protein kinase n=1 Tax=Streptomyces hoynatensis TaxID=1141874 RepID=A0A3A9Z3S0_9ACTN|nr:protein kinase [Streptomyces hoynatensis]RKN42915.1 serine/threonine protein kinase [Streptomyces hoynatensis]
MTGSSGEVPERLGDYVLERRLGSGGMGVVHLARTVAGRQLAIKVIRHEYAEDPGFRARFRREVAAARRVSGAFTAPVVDADPEGDPPWLATLYVPGGSLADRVERDGPLGGPEAARIGAELAEALLDIHRCGLVHRDLKPGNVLLAGDGVRVIDFGISRALDDGRRLTEDGAVLGSPPFMAPEQLTGGAEVTWAADVFALGAVVAYAATGRSPFEAGRQPGGDPLAVAYRVVHEEPELSGVPASLRDLVALCLAKDPDERPEVAAVLRMAAWAGSRAQAAAIRESPAWQGGQRHGGRAPAGAGREERDGSAGARGARVGSEARRARGRRRAWLVAAAVVALAAAGGGALLARQAGGEGQAGPSRDASDDPAGGGASATGPPRPWELDLREHGVLDAATAGLRCAPAGGDLLCGAGAELAVLFGPEGTERWTHGGPRDALGGPAPLAVGDTVFARSDKGVVALAREDGEERWEIDAPELTGSLVATDRSLALQNGDSTLRFYALDSPEPLGTWETPGRYVTATLGNADRVLVLSRDAGSGGDLALTLLGDAGRELWPGPVPPPAEAAGDLRPLGMDASAGYFEELDPEVPVVTAVLRLDLRDGSWTRTELPEAAEQRSVLADGLVYVSTGAGRLAAVDPAAGELLWQADLTEAEPPLSEPAVANGLLYLSDAEGRLRRVDAADGEPRGVGEPHPGTPGPGSDAWAPPPVIEDGVAYVVTLGNTLYAMPLGD